ncbi:AI-2E family transporter [Virgibacillus phasianinus]|uniref:AI-2E family transporter n=1 Tax=Virgibacillus phasianinus TaxID=2017483 RepID=A0A220U0Z8_9BACI|nr:AI-2E family transporter [Virgibacillus phasianinus]ASK61944.1 AI-2E family transporter [Virgibacillus phasianinus]
MWIRHSFFKYATGTLIVLLCIYFLGKVDFFLNPFQKLVTILFFPIIISGLFYYILRPVVELVAKQKFLNRSVAIIVVYAIAALLVYLFIQFVGGKIVDQAQQLTDQLPTKVENTVEQTKRLIEKNNFGMFSVEEIKQKSITFLSDLAQTIGDNIAAIVGAITSVATVLVLVPFILFYFLKDGHKLLPYLLNFIPKKHMEEGEAILKDIDRTLASYILGQLTVGLVDGTLMYIGYLVIDLDYALVLALFVIITAVVPLIGPALGVLPAILIALIQDPIMVVYVLIILFIVQQLEGNLVSPAVFGKRLQLHPLTIILLLVVAGALYGFVGILIAIPLYAVLKVTIKNFYKLYRLRKS